MKRYKPVSLKKIKTYSLSKRKSKVEIVSAASLYESGNSFSDFIKGHHEIMFPLLAAVIIEEI
ncbi:MAG: hypothetical protein WC581_02355 [Thermodesulfovibrionales bacterium]